MTWSGWSGASSAACSSRYHPGHGKTLHCSHAFPPFYLGRHPEHQVILASHTAELAQDNSRAARGFMQDPRYPFPVGVSKLSSSVGRWHTTAGGVVIADGVGGGLTGFGAHLLIVDDPVKTADEADSATTRDRHWAWFTQVAMTRLMPNSIVLLMMTRWHEDDIAGRILNSRGADGWHVLRLPAVAERDDPLGRKEGEALWEECYPIEELPSVEKGEISSRAFAAMYQQRPTPETGFLIKRAWLEGRYTTFPQHERVTQTVDAAFKTGIANDYSVIATWGPTAPTSTSSTSGANASNIPTSIAHSASKPQSASHARSTSKTQAPDNP